MAQDLVISYFHNERGRVDEEFDNVESFDCVVASEGDGKTLIVRHPNQTGNTTRYNVASLIGSELQ